MASITNDHVRMKQTATALGAPEKDYELFCTLVTMKPLPDTEQYKIPPYAKDWDPLPSELQMIALKSGKFHMPSEDEYKNELSEEQRLTIRKHFRKLMDKKRIALLRILKQMPKTMFLLLRFVYNREKEQNIIVSILLLFRNLNSVRNTLKIHNISDANRTALMTEGCQQALKDLQTKKRKFN